MKKNSLTWTNYETRRLYDLITSDPDLPLFLVREFALIPQLFDPHGESEARIIRFIDLMLSKHIITEKLDITKVHITQFMARFLDQYQTEINNYNYFITQAKTHTMAR